MARRRTTALVRARWRPAALLATLATLLLAGMPAGARAAIECPTCTPWWHLLSLSRPTNLHPGVGADEVQQITVDALAGNVVVVEPVSFEELLAGQIEFPQLKFTQFAWDAAPAAAQSALESLYGTGNVQVTGGPSALGTGDLSEGSSELTAVSVQSGSFTAGQLISGEGIPPGTTIVHAEGQQLTLSAPVEAGRSATGVALAVLAPYTVTFKGALADQALKPMNTELGFLGALNGTATATQVSEGRPDGYIVISAADVGDGPADGQSAPIELTDSLPAGLTPVSIAAHVPNGNAVNQFLALGCSLTTLTCESRRSLPPFDQIEMRIGVVVSGAETGAENHAAITGGGAPAAHVEHPITVSSAPAPFGVEQYELDNEEAGGTPDLQAGSHPFQQTTTIAFNTSSANASSAEVSALAKDLSFRWPAGMIGNPQLFAHCTLAQFFSKQCPPQSVLGVATTNVDEPGSIGIANFVQPLYNLEPAPGEAARLGFLAAGTPVFIDATVRSGEDYGVTVHVQNITQEITFLSSEVTVWGVPGRASHDPARGEGCMFEARGLSEKEIVEQRLSCRPEEQNEPPAFLTLGSACPPDPASHLPLGAASEVYGDSWQSPGSGEGALLASTRLPGLDGCNRLPFTPSIAVKPDIQEASRPMGLTVDVHVPQAETVNAAGLAESGPRTITVALPEGVAVNPSAGDGLAACSQALVGFRGEGELPTDPAVNHLLFTPKLPGSVGSEELFSPDVLEPGVNFCADASKIATARITTPVLANPIEGAVYLASQNQNPFGALLAMYIVAEDPVSGVLVKLAGQVQLSPGGRLVATFENSPQAPFEDAVLHFFGGERAPLASPAHCGAYTTSASFTSWSSSAALSASSTFDITSGPGGGPCPGATLPFGPSLTGGTTNVAAGAFSPLTTTIAREDGEQNLAQVTLHMPPGLEGLLAGVKLCDEADANAGTCGPESEIGETTVSAGVGSDPVAVHGGRVYLTGSYAGAPFGLSIVNPVKAGPFDLEHDSANPAQNPPCDCVVVRAKIEVNPQTAELTVTTDPSGPHAIPHLIDGIPVQIKKVNVLIDRERFIFNPTSCNPLSLTGSIGSDEGAAAPFSAPFQVHDCASLKFTPTVKVSTAGHASKVNGASLNFRIAYPRTAMGTQSWFNEAKFDIPRQLPARLTTIQKACLAATFEHNRPACPPASIIGHAVVHTPVLPVPLEGPVYFVSYGGAAFPDAVVVLDGYGVHIELHGNTFINGKTGVTSATFKNTPDVPFESIEVSIPTGPFSEFGANLPHGALSFCGQKLVMPTLLKAQNGLEIKRNTPVTVTGCAKVKTRAQKLKAALKACHRRHGHKRAACEKAARRAYGARASKGTRRA